MVAMATTIINRHFGLRKSRVARNVSKRMPTKIKPSVVKLEKEEEAWATCRDVDVSPNINLWRVRLQILNNNNNNIPTVFSGFSGGS